VINNSSSGQGHESLVSTVLGEVLERDPSTIRVVRADSLTALPSNSPVGSRMAIMLGGATAGAAKRIKQALLAIAAHNFECSPEDLEYRGGDISLKGVPSKKLSWEALVEIAHRKFHRLPGGLEPGLQASFVWEVPTGGGLPTADGRIQMYPCYAFEAHVVLVGDAVVADWSAARVAPGITDGASAVPIASAGGDPIRFPAPGAGRWSVQVQVRFPGGSDSAAYYWLLDVR